MNSFEKKIRTIPDFPRPGIQFKDISPLLADGPSFHQVTDCFRERYAEQAIDLVVGIEARGFVFAAALAYALGAGTAMIRKPGKLPHAVHRKTYDLEYGTDAIEIHTDAIAPGQRILLMDDVLATGGTAAAAADLITTHFEAEIVEFCFLIELSFLNGRNRLKGLPAHALINYS